MRDNRVRTFLEAKGRPWKHFYLSRGGHENCFTNFCLEKFHLHILVNCNVLNTISCKIWRKFLDFWRSLLDCINGGKFFAYFFLEGGCDQNFELQNIKLTLCSWSIHLSNYDKVKRLSIFLEKYTAKRQRTPFQIHPSIHNVYLTYCVVTWLWKAPLTLGSETDDKLSC